MNRANTVCEKMLSCRPPRVALALLIAASIIQILLPPNGLPAFPAAGVGVSLLGLVLMLRAWWLFRRHKTAICPTAVTTAFLSDDVYALTRNPMYLGMVTLLLGIALVFASWAHYLATAVYALILDRVFCRYEEQSLHRQYGNRYALYAARVRRWV